MLFTTSTEFLPDEHIKELAKNDNLEAIQYLAMSVDTSENSLGDLGPRLPGLRELRLDGSNIKTLRDLGSGLGELRVLWLGRSRLCELEGIHSFGALSELYLAFNEVEDLSPLMGAERLQVLDLEANAVTDPAQIDYLSGCAELHSLTLEGNPIAESADYREQVQIALPQLALLDELPLADGPPGPTARTDAWVSSEAEGYDDDDSSRQHALALAASAAVGASEAPGSDAWESKRRELRLIRDGIKYTDALRAYDVESRVALAMDHAMAHSSSRDGGGSRGSSSRGGSRDGCDARGGKSRARLHSATTDGTASTTPGGSHGGSSWRGSLASGGLPPSVAMGERRPSSSSLSSFSSLSRGAGSSSASSVRNASRPATAAHRLMTASRAAPPGLLEECEEASALTFGDDVLVCGNPTKALREKRRNARVAAAEPPPTASPPASPQPHCWSSPSEPKLPAALRPSHGGHVGRHRPADAEAAELLAELYRFKLRTAVEGTTALDAAPAEDDAFGPTAAVSTAPAWSRVGISESGRRSSGTLAGRRTPGSVADEGILVGEEADDVLLLDVDGDATASPVPLG